MNPAAPLCMYRVLTTELRHLERYRYQVSKNVYQLFNLINTYAAKVFTTNCGIQRIHCKTVHIKNKECLQF